MRKPLVGERVEARGSRGPDAPHRGAKGPDAVTASVTGVLDVDVGQLAGLAGSEFGFVVQGSMQVHATIGVHRLRVEHGPRRGTSVTVRRLAPGARPEPAGDAVLRREFSGRDIVAAGTRKLSVGGAGASVTTGTVAGHAAAVLQLDGADHNGRHVTVAAVDSQLQDLAGHLEEIAAGVTALLDRPAQQAVLPFTVPSGGGASVRERVLVQVPHPTRPGDVLLEWEACRDSALDHPVALEQAAQAAFAVHVRPSGSRVVDIVSAPGLALAGIGAGRHKVAVLSAAAHPGACHIGVTVAREALKLGAAEPDPFRLCLPFVRVLGLRPEVALAPVPKAPPADPTPPRRPVMPPSARDVIAIDFGTTFTSAVLRRPGREPVALSFPGGSSRIPSSVFRRDSGELVAGELADRQAALSPASYEPTPKRRAGYGTIGLGDGTVTDVELIAAVLSAVAGELRAQRDGSINADVWLTHPAAWNATRRGVLTAAAAAAGLGTVSLLEEPVAAAGYYASRSRGVGGDSAVGVYDLGGGTFDAAVVSRDGGSLRLAGKPTGIDLLGGVDFDHLLFQHIGLCLSERHPQEWARIAAPSDLEWRRYQRQLFAEVRSAKESLSVQTTCEMFVPGLNTSVTVVRSEFEELIRPKITQTVEALLATIRAAGFAPGDLFATYLVGGSSRIPLVHRMVWDGLGAKPIAQDDPKLVTAIGAAASVELIAS